jgi:hypothetical protein
MVHCFLQNFQKKFLRAGIIGACFWCETQDQGMGVSKIGASQHKNLTPVPHYEIVSHNVKWCTATMVQCNNDAPQHNGAMQYVAPQHNHNGNMVICCTATWAIRICCTATIWRAV